MQIDSFNEARLRNAEFVSLGDHVLKITKAYDWSKFNVLGFYTKVETTVGNLKTHLNKLSTVSETHSVEIADAAFNNAWRAFKFVCKALELHPDADKREAAKTLIELSKTHGYNLHNEGYPVQNASARMFLSDCMNKEEAKAAIKTLAIQENIDQIESALNILVSAIETRKSKFVSEKRDDNTKFLRQKLSVSLDSMFMYLVSMSALEPGGELDKIIKEINESIQKLEISIKMRTTHKTEETEQN
ncbi:DUF6261 family protein [Ancylomarina sp. YFZ004]